MISYKDGDILTSTADAIVIPVNCVGVMGAGLAKQFANKFPVGEEIYNSMCETKTIKMKSVAWGFTDFDVKRRVVFFPTKYHWSDKSNYDEIEASLRAMKWSVNVLPEIESIAIPKIGCGLGGLKWEKVHKLIVDILGPAEFDTIIYGQPV